LTATFFRVIAGARGPRGLGAAVLGVLMDGRTVPATALPAGALDRPFNSGGNPISFGGGLMVPLGGLTTRPQWTQVRSVASDQNSSIMRLSWPAMSASSNCSS